MIDFQLTTPVVFIIFNRPDKTQEVFNKIREARPSKLLVIADGPRAGRRDDREECAATRVIIESVDWDCEVIQNYSETNLGCGKRIASGLDWVFNIVEEAIILEDDCLPHPTFFRYCQETLERYRDDGRIMAIGANHYEFGRRRMEYSYHFSRYPHIWCWATWRRAWQYYDFEMKLWPEVRDHKWLFDIFGKSKAEFSNGKHEFKILGGARDAEYWHSKFELVYRGGLNTWDYQVNFACFLQHGLVVLPNVNLVSNIGFGVKATHTKNISELANVPVTAMEFPLKHPPFVIRDTWADEYMQSIFIHSC